MYIYSTCEQFVLGLIHIEYDMILFATMIYLYPVCTDATARGGWLLIMDHSDVA